MTSRKGFTLIETLIALAIFSVLIGIVFQTTTRYLQARTEQDAATTAQAKLRRIVEVFTQDLRSAVLGAIIDVPYASDNRNISFALIDGGAYNAMAFNTNDYYLDVASIDAPDFRASDYALLVNNVGDAVVFPVSAVHNLGGGRWRIDHSGCRNTITYTLNTLVFPIRTMGISYNMADQVLMVNEGTTTLPYAFNITGFEVDYVYLDNTSNATIANPAGFNPHNRPPLKQFGGTTGNRYILQRLRLTLATTEEARGRTFSRQLVSNVELSSNTTYNIRGVVPCN